MAETTPCDLHVLSMPPAFALSQDQTLRFIHPQAKTIRQTNKAKPRPEPQNIKRKASSSQNTPASNAIRTGTKPAKEPNLIPRPTKQQSIHTRETTARRRQHIPSIPMKLSTNTNHHIRKPRLFSNLTSRDAEARPSSRGPHTHGQQENRRRELRDPRMRSTAINPGDRPWPRRPRIRCTRHGTI